MWKIKTMTLLLLCIAMVGMVSAQGPKLTLALNNPNPPQGVDHMDYGTSVIITLTAWNWALNNYATLIGERSIDGGPWIQFVSTSVPGKSINSNPDIVSGGHWTITDAQTRFRYKLTRGTNVSNAGFAIYRNDPGPRYVTGEQTLKGGALGKTYTLVVGPASIPWGGKRLAYSVTKTTGVWMGGTPMWYSASDEKDGRVLIKIKVPPLRNSTVYWRVDYWMGPSGSPHVPTTVTRSDNVTLQCSFFGQNTEIVVGPPNFPYNGYRIAPCVATVTGDGSFRWDDWVYPNSGNSGLRKIAVHLEGEGLGHKEATVHWTITSWE